MALRQARVGLLGSGLGLGLVAAAALAIATEASLAPWALGVGALAGASIAAVLGWQLLTPDRLRTAARSGVAAWATVGTLAVLLAGVLVEAFTAAPVEAVLPLVLGAGLASAAAMATYAAANHSVVAWHREHDDVFVRVSDEPSDPALLAARVVGLLLVATVAATAYLAVETGDAFVLTIVTLLAATTGTDFLAPRRVGLYTPGYWDLQYVVDDGLLRPSGLSTWDEFEGWDEAGDALRLHAGGRGSNAFELSPSAADRDVVRSLLGSRLDRLD